MSQPNLTIGALVLGATLPFIGIAHAQKAPASAARYELTLFAFPAPPPAELSWKTPGGLVRRVLVNEVGSRLKFFTRKIGHAGVRVECGAFGQRSAGHFQGSMGEKYSAEFQDIVLKKKYGLGLLFHNFTGELETEPELERTIQQRIRDGRGGFIRFAISPTSCHRLLDYVVEYQRHNVQRYYGLAARPLYREGAGCSAFSMAFLELANLIEPRFLAAWSFSVRAPMRFIGGPMGGGKKVGIGRLAFSSRPWARPGEPGIDLFGWDPTQMYHWIRDTIRGARAGRNKETPEYRGKMIGLFMDRRAVQPTTGSFWKN